MPTERNHSALGKLMAIKDLEYLKRFGRQVTLLQRTNTLNEDEKISNTTITQTTIWGDLQFENIPKFYDNYGISPEGDGMFFTLSSYGVNVNDEIIDPDDSTIKWKLIKQIENETVGTNKPYVGFYTQKAA